MARKNIEVTTVGGDLPSPPAPDATPTKRHRRPIPAEMNQDHPDVDVEFDDDSELG